ncbi:MAG: hypothetical protein HOV68_20965, partial [Streptomycetaceae bacterium]|nr:hypothetical protein [Streptomycetaceae bacterium]
MNAAPPLAGRLPDGFADGLAGWPDPAAAERFMRTDPGYDTAWWRQGVASGWFRQAFAARFGGADDFASLAAMAERLGA